MNAGFDKNEAELGVFVFSVALEMLADSDSLCIISDYLALEEEEDGSYLFDQHVEVLGNLWSEAYHAEITLSVEDQAEAMLLCVCRRTLRRKLFHIECTVPLDLRMRRILLPTAHRQPPVLF